MMKILTKTLLGTVVGAVFLPAATLGFMFLIDQAAALMEYVRAVYGPSGLTVLGLTVAGAVLGAWASLMHAILVKIAPSRIDDDR